MRLPVAELAAADAHLWLWTTNALLPRAYEVAQAWGFTVRSPLTWVKFRLGLSGRYQLRNATEQLLFCTRGRAPLGNHSQPTWFNAPVLEHSRKPAEQFAIIERISRGPFLELFARQRPESNQEWAIWGNEVVSDVRIPGYGVARYSGRVAGDMPGQTQEEDVMTMASTSPPSLSRGLLRLGLGLLLVAIGLEWLADLVRRLWPWLVGGLVVAGVVAGLVAWWRARHLW